MSREGTTIPGTICVSPPNLPLVGAVPEFFDPCALCLSLARSLPSERSKEIPLRRPPGESFASKSFHVLPPESRVFPATGVFI